MFGFKFLYYLRKKVVINALIVLLFVQAILLTHFHLFGPIVDVQVVLDKLLQPSTFHRKASKLLAQIQKDPERFWITNSDLTHLETEIPVEKILVEEGTEGPGEVFYDPRFTIAAYLDELSRVGQSEEVPTLPFHWVDWMDATFSDTQIGKTQTKHMPCSFLQDKIRGKPDSSGFCKDRDELSPEELESLGYRNRAQLPKAVIFKHCSHKNPSVNAIRVFMAKSYTSTHLPKPFRVIILNAGENGGTYEFMVNQTQGSDQRLMYSGMSERFVSSVSGTPAWELVAQGGSFKFNPKEVFANLVSTVEPRVLSDEDDIMHMHRTVRSPQGSSKDLYLQEKHFHYSKDAVQQQIEEYEAMSSRNLMEQTYLDGLKISSRHDGRSEPAYFRMAVLDLKEPRNTRHEGGWHYDWRFFNDGLFYDREGWTKAERSERASIVIERLSRNWNRFAEEKGIVSWIMHGPLLSWYWDGLMFPYDVDIDIQMPISELTRLARDYNQTLVIENPSEGYGRYLIDVGTYIHNRERSYTGNHIDARFIDVDSGIYIDITGLSQSSTNLPKEYDLKPIVSKQDGDSSAEVYNDRRKHFYTLPQISPLRYSMMGGVPLYVPHEIRERLEWEYSRGLTSYEYRGWYFVPKLQLWVMKEKLLWLFNKEDYQNDEQKFDKNKMVELVKALSDDEAMRLLEDDDILTEYYFTCQLTDWHMHEKTFLFTAEGKDNVAGMDDPSTRKSYNNLVGKVKFSKPLRKALFEYENFERMAHHRVGTQGRVRENA